MSGAGDQVGGVMSSPMHGVIAFPITPADSYGRVDGAALADLVELAVAGGVHAVCVLGSTGSYAFLSTHERRRAVAAAAAQVNGRIPLLAGVGALRTDEAVLHARAAADLGATAGLLAPISYTPLTDEEVLTHFATVAREGALPLCIYDNPVATHRSLDDALLQSLAALPGIVALKTPAPDRSDVGCRLTQLKALTPKHVAVGFSVDRNAAEGLIAGADAWFSVLAGLAPAPVVAIGAAVMRGDLQAARQLNGSLRPIWNLLSAFGGLRVMHAAADLLLGINFDPPRPILPLPTEACVQLTAAIRALVELGLNEQSGVQDPSGSACVGQRVM